MVGLRGTFSFEKGEYRREEGGEKLFSLLPSPYFLLPNHLAHSH
jgi:hypothetical protein